MSEQLGLLGDNTPGTRFSAVRVMPAAQHRHSDPVGSRRACERYRLKHDGHDATVLRALELLQPATYHDLEPSCGGLELIQIRRALDRLRHARRKVVDGEPIGPITRPPLTYVVRDDQECSCGCGQFIQSWALTGHVTG